MRKLVVSEFVEHDTYRYEELLETSALLLGRVTYEGFSAAWPKVTGEFADRMNALPKYVMSSTLHEPLEWNASPLKGDLTSEVETLKRQDGDRHIFVHGSRSFDSGVVALTYARK